MAMAGSTSIFVRSFEKIDVSVLFRQHNSHSRICNTRRWSPRRLPKPGSCETFYYTIFERPRTRYYVVWCGVPGMAIACSLSSPAFGSNAAVAVCARRAQCEIFRPSFSLPGTLALSAYRRRRLMADWKQGTDLLFSTRTVVLPIFRSSSKMRSLFAVLLSLLLLSATTTVAAELRGEIVSCSG